MLLYLLSLGEGGAGLWGRLCLLPGGSKCSSLGGVCGNSNPGEERSRRTRGILGGDTELPDLRLWKRRPGSKIIKLNIHVQRYQCLINSLCNIRKLICLSITYN